MTKGGIATVSKTKLAGALALVELAIKQKMPIFAPVGSSLFAVEIWEDSSDGKIVHLLEYHASSKATQRAVANWIIKEYARKPWTSPDCNHRDEWDLKDELEATRYLKSHSDKQIIREYFEERYFDQEFLIKKVRIEDMAERIQAI